MEPLSREERQLIVKNELFLLKEGKYISSHMYQDVVKAHQKFYHDLAVKEDRIEQAPELEKPLRPDVPSKPLTPQVQQKKKLKPVISAEKKKLTMEQIRERNITWLLNLGVILLLIGGLYVATSNWETMSSITKAGSIGLISILFYGIAFVSKRVLHIDKTAFAFIVLGSLFLPIFLLSIGWFELIGTYLSIYGEGRYLFGMLSSFLVLPVYVLFAGKLKSRLFVWFSYITLTIGVGFLWASFRFGEDGYFLAMMLYQAILIFLYHRIKENEKFMLYTKEFLYFAQLNLILTTVLMLVLYYSPVYFGFNLMLTAVIYLSMVYVTGRKEFHFVFSAMFVFGAYQIVQFSVLTDFSPLLFAAIGFVFLLVPRFLDDQYPWKKIFTITSGIVSGIAFLFITFEAILINWGNPSLMLLLAYMTISGNFLYLSNTTNKLLFRYLTAIFLSVTLFEMLLLVNEAVVLSPFILYVFLIGFILFILGAFIRGLVFELIKQPARDIGWVYMGTATYAGLVMYDWWEFGVMLLLIGLCGYISLEKETRGIFKPFGEWLIPISLSFAVASFGEEWRQASEFYEFELGVPVHFILASMVLLGLKFVSKNATLKRNHFFVSQAFYTVGILSAVVFPINDVVRVVLFLGGIGMYAMLYTYTKIKYTTYLVSALTLTTYFTVLDTVGDRGNLQLVSGGVLLFAISLFFKNKDFSLFKAFAHVGHLYMPIAFLLTLFIYGKESLWSFLIGLVIYGVSTKMVEREWKKKLFLYSSFTIVFLISATGIARFDSVVGEFAYLITSVIVTGFWLFSDGLYKRRTLYFLVPVSILGVIAFISMYPYDLVPFIVTLLYSIGVLVVLHLAKWEFLSVIPTLLIYVGTLQYLLFHPFTAMNELLTLAVFGIVFLLAGKWFYPQLWGRGSKHIPSIDVYTIGAFLFFVTMYGFEQPNLLAKVLPGILLVLTFWFQRKRISAEDRWIPTFLSGAYVLQPYYALVGEIDLHYLLEREIYVLPWIILGIYLRMCLQGKFEKITNQLQWVILVVVAAVLVVDGLETSTIYDALILGSLSLISILVGVFLRIKAYFLVGTAVLLLNVFMQTRPFWGNLPWWAYLLIAGSILIGVASSNEWNKQKSATGQKTIVSTLKNKGIEIWKQWK